jgi:hypothetical protein
MLEIAPPDNYATDEREAHFGELSTPPKSVVSGKLQVFDCQG